MRSCVQSVSKSLTIEKPFYKFDSHWCIMVCSFKMTVSSVKLCQHLKATQYMYLFKYIFVSFVLNRDTVLPGTIALYCSLLKISSNILQIMGAAVTLKVCRNHI